MPKSTDRNIAELLKAYCDYLLSKVSKVRILGESDERELKDVFVELSIVDQRPEQHAEFLGMMDRAMRRRLNPFADAETDESREIPERQKETKRRVKPEELLRRRTKAIVTGAPGCGKTTLLKFLAMRAAEKEKRFAVWLELKAIDKHLFAEAEKAAARDSGLILRELWLRHLKTQLSLNNAETKALREHWQQQFKASEIVVLLDGFDELQDEAVERSLNKCVREFASAHYENTLLISTRPYAQHKLGNESLQELEIEPLNQRQIKAFLNCYYLNDVAAKSLLKRLRERSPLRELLQVPLLLGIILRLHRENRATDERLKLYEAIITDLVHELDRSKSIIRPFKINDERLRLDFLKFLAFERLLLNPLEEEANRIVFSYDMLKEKARSFLAQERSAHDARDLADDALATPLLREISATTFAFTHLTLQEYLAARAFAVFLQKKGNEIEGLRIFCRAYHLPTIVEMEVLPMTLGAITNADNLYAEIECWPESLTFSNLRLRARGLAYWAKIKQNRLSDLIGRLLEFISEAIREETAYRNIVINSFIGINGQTVALLEAKTISLIKAGAHNLCDKPELLCDTPEVLGKLGSEKAIEALISALKDNSSGSRAALALGWLGSEKSVGPLISALRDDNIDIRESAAVALGELGSDTAIEPLISSLRDDEIPNRWFVYEALAKLGSQKGGEPFISVLMDDNSHVRLAAARVLGKLGVEKAVKPLISSLKKDDDGYVRESAAEALGEIGLEKAIAALISALKKDTESQVRSSAAKALGKIDSEKAAAALILALKNDDEEYVRESAAEALGEIGSDQAVAALISALKDDGCNDTAAKALGRTRSETAVAPLILASKKDHKSYVRRSATEALGEIGSETAVPALISVLQKDEDSYVRSSAAKALREIGSETAVPALIEALKDNDGYVIASAADALRVLGSEQAVKPLIFTFQEGYRLARAKEDGAFGPRVSGSTLGNDGYTVARWNAARALGQIGSVQAVEPLISVLKNGHSLDRIVTAEALRKPVPENVVELPNSALEDDNDDMLSIIAEALGKLGSERVVDPLISALRDDGTSVRLSALKALTQMKVDDLILGLAQTIKQGDTYARKKAATIIGYYHNDKQTLDQLRQLAQADEDTEVRRAAKKAAEKFGRKLERLGHFITEGESQPLSDNESRELFLVGEAFRVAAEAGHIFRPTANSDWGIDGEIEFKNDRGEATGRKVYLQLKSGDSYLRKRKRDGKEIFTIKPRHAAYWLSHAYPVMLVIRNSAGQIRWMNVTEYIQRYGTTVKQIEFQGEPFTAESVKQMRE